MSEIKNDLKEILFTEEEISNRVVELATQINNDYQDKDLVVVTILKGAAPFAADLIRRLDRYIQADYLVAGSYGSGTSSSGIVDIVKDIDLDVEGKNVLIVDDILDTGNTLDFIKKLFLMGKQCADVRVCVLLDKPSRRTKNITPDYCGFTIPDKFVVGYGLDFNQLYRNLPYVGVLKEEKYK